MIAWWRECVSPAEDKPCTVRGFPTRASGKRYYQGSIQVYAVIFSAEIGELDEDYAQTAVTLRERAMQQYGCVAFESVTENGRELTVSHWRSLEDIARWKQDPAHEKAQARGRAKWYRAHQVHVVEVLRAYAHEPKEPT